MQQIDRSVVTKDAKGLFRFAQSKQTTSSDFVTDEKESVLTKDAAGRFRFVAEMAAPAMQQIDQSVVTKDAKGRFRFAHSKQTTSSEFVTDEKESVLTKDAAGRFRFVAEMAAPASAPPSAPPSATSVSEPSRIADGGSNIGSNIAVSFLGPAFAFIAVLALVGNMAGGPSKEELERRRAEEAAAATRTTAFTTVGLAAGIAYIFQKPSQKNSKNVQQKELRQEARKAVAEWKLVRKNTEKGMGIMWSGDY